MAFQWLTLEGELPRVGPELLRALAVQRLAELPDEMLEPPVLLAERDDLGLELGAGGALGLDRRPDVGRQGGEVEAVRAAGHSRFLSQSQRAGMA